MTSRFSSQKQRVFPTFLFVNSKMAEDDAKSELQGASTDQNPNSVEATIETSVACGATESTCNNNNGITAESSSATDRGEREKSLEFAEELMERGSKASKEGDFGEATDCYSRALEIRVAHFGELAPECVSSYYKFGCALLYKAQEEADPLGSVPKKEDASQENSYKDGTIKAAHESSAAFASNNAEAEDGEGEKGGDGSDDEELVDGDEDESDLDLSWKMLDVARAIVEKHSGDTMEKVDILSALAEVALEREDVETSLSDYSKALTILERLVVPDSRLIAELNFRICLCLEIGSKPEEAIPYCQKAISVCKARVKRLTDEVKNLSGSAETESATESRKAVQLSSSTSVPSDDSRAEIEAEIEMLNGLCSDLDKKLEDLQQLVSNPKSILSDILGIMSAKAKAKAAEQGAVPVSASSGTAGAAGGTTSTAVINGTNGASGVTHLGVVGRGVKRVVMSSNMQTGTTKKPAIDPSTNGCDGDTA